MDTDQTSEKILEDRIIKDIEKTGYPTEIQSASKMINDGWKVIHNPSFLDKDERTCREFDIEAIKSHKSKVGLSTIPRGYTPQEELERRKGIYFYTNVRLICECKKSDNRPWIFFITKELDKSSVFLNEYIHRSFAIDPGNTKDKFGDRDSDFIFNHSGIRSAHHYLENDYFARTYYEAFKGKDPSQSGSEVSLKDKDGNLNKIEESNKRKDKIQKGNDKPQQIYDAVMSCIKATLYLEDSSKPNHLFINYPIIILKGNLFTSSIVDNKITINKTNHIQLVSNYITSDTIKDNITPHTNKGRILLPLFYSPLGNRHKFIIDIVNFDYLEEFLKSINKEFSTINTLINDILE